MELLIVIGVLGILAAGLLAAIDPFEQLKKARDTNNRSAALELLSASQRYYANHGYLPWFKGGTGSYTCPSDFDRIRTISTEYPYNSVIVAATGSAQQVLPVTDCIGSLLGADGEIKNTFFEGLKTDLYLQSGSLTRAAVCFSPESKSNRSDESTKYLLSGTSPSFVVSESGGLCPNPTNGLCLQCFE